MIQKINTLTKIAKMFNNNQINWALGASTMLYFNDIVNNFNDIDILVAESDIARVKQILKPYGCPSPATNNPQYKTKHFLTYQINGVSIDVFAGFTIINAGQSYYLPLTPDQIATQYNLNGQLIPLMSVDIWHDYYQLMSRTDKTQLLNNYRGIDHSKYSEFIKITKTLNSIDIIPVLMGSVGMEYITHRAWQPSDIDIHVPGDPRGWQAPDNVRIDQWPQIEKAMTNIGYQLYDLDEHDMRCADFRVGFGNITTLPTFAGIPLQALPLRQYDGAQFKLPTAAQFLKIYQASSKDSYRNEQNNDKDFLKIDFLKQILKNK